MTTEPDRLAALIERLRAGGDAPARPSIPFPGLAGELVYAFLVWEAGRQRADRAARRVASAVVDLNDLRVCLPHEMRAMFGHRYPLGMDRARRLRASLHDIYERENQVTLEPLAAAPKRDARDRLMAIPGVVPFVAARVTLLGLDGHAMPVDGRLARALRREGALPADIRVEEAGAWMERHVRAADALDTYLRLERWVDEPAEGGEDLP